MSRIRTDLFPSYREVISQYYYRQDIKFKLKINLLLHVYNHQIVELVLLMILNIIGNLIKNNLVLLLYTYHYLVTLWSS
jgi:hypothetical protein